MRTDPRCLVRVNDDLLLDAGTWEEPSGVDGTALIVRPPSTPLFRQVLDYLEAKPDPSIPPSGSRTGREGVAAAAVTIRWGSYFSVLADRTKPLWAEAISSDSHRSRISDGEMARINIEASAAMAEWADLCRRYAGMGLYLRLVDRAVAYLPMPQKTSTREDHPFLALANPEVAQSLAQAVTPECLALARRDADLHPTRLFANALINYAWRNGPVEKIHSGLGQGYPVNRRRVTPGEERTLFKVACRRMSVGMGALISCDSQEKVRTWSEVVLPYGLAGALLITPVGWTLTETSREVRLPLPVMMTASAKNKERAE